MATTRDDLHRLIDDLSETMPPDLLGRVLQALRDGRPVEPIDLLLLLAPVDDEPVTNEDRAAIAAADADGRVASASEVWKRLKVPRVLQRRRRSPSQGWLTPTRAAAMRRARGRKKR
jgi:hypothetical protein